MKRHDHLTDSAIRAAFERRAARGEPGELRDRILASTSAIRQDAGWRVRIGQAWSLPATPAMSPVLVGLLLVAALLALGVVLAIVGHRTPVPVSEAPRAGLVAFIRDGDVYLANPDGSSAALIAHRDGLRFSRPSWSPDASQLAIETDEPAVLILDPASGSLRRVASGRLIGWSGTGRSLATVDDASVIRIVDVETGTSREVPRVSGSAAIDGMPYWTPAWSPNGRWIAVTVEGNPSGGGRTGPTFVRIDVDTGAIKKLDTPGSNGFARNASWSRDSSRLAVERRTGGLCTTGSCTTIEVIDADGSARVVVADRGDPVSPVWSPDGSWIAYGNGLGSPLATLWIVRPDGRDPRELAIGPIDQFAWNTDGTAIDYSLVKDSSETVRQPWSVSLADGISRPLAVVGERFAWQPTSAGRPAPTLPPGASVVAIGQSPSVGSPAAATPASPVPSSPATGPLADPGRAWFGLGVDVGDPVCGAGVLDLKSGLVRAVGFAVADPAEIHSSCSSGIWSPDGSASVALADTTATVIRRDGGTRRVLAGVTDVQGASWSPDGHWLLLDRCTGPGLCPDAFSIVRQDGTGLQPLAGHAMWSPDAQRMAVPAADGRLLIGRGDGSDLHSIGTYPAPLGWSPDNQSLVYLRGGDAWIVGADGGDPHNLTQFELGGATGAQWSPDGRFIVVRRASRDLWLFSPDGRVRERLDLGGLPNDLGGAPTWSPDSARFALDFTTHRAGDPRGDRSSILVVTIEGRRLSVLADASGPVWSPDGRFLALSNSANMDHGGAIDVANADGTGRWTVWTGAAAGAYSSMTAWLP